MTRQALPSIPPTACTKISSFVCPFRAIIILAPDFTSSCPSQLLQLVAAACFKNWVSHLVRKLAPAWFEELVVGRKCIKGYREATGLYYASCLNVLLTYFYFHSLYPFATRVKLVFCFTFVSTHVMTIKNNSLIQYQDFRTQGHCFQS